MKKQAILVTGAQGGIGQAIVKHLDSLTAPERVILTTDLVANKSSGIDKLDVTDAGACESFMERIQRTYSLQAVVHAAGVLVHGPAMETKTATAEHAIRVNFLGSINVLRAAAKTMVSQDPYGVGNQRCLLTVGSNSARRPRANLAVYSATKAAASQFTRSLGLEIAKHGIRCLVVSPGTTRTNMVHTMWNGQDHSTQTITGNLSTYQPGIPLGRIGEPEDIAPLIGFLLSDHATHLTLGDIAIDGGASQS